MICKLSVYFYLYYVPVIQFGCAREQARRECQQALASDEGGKRCNMKSFTRLPAVRWRQGSRARRSGTAR